MLIVTQRPVGDCGGHQRAAPSDYQRKEALKRRATDETLAEIAKSYAVDLSMISRLS